MNRPKVIAEIGCNHKGDFKIAKKMIRIAKDFCDVDVVKFQKRNPKELLSEAEYNSPHPVPYNSYGETYGQHREFLEFTKKEHQQLKDYCEKLDMEYSTSVWDLTSAREIISMSPNMIKIPSACNLNFELLFFILKNFSGEIHISLGMTSKEEIDLIIKFLKSNNGLKSTILYSCTSAYPAPFSSLSLLEIKHLKRQYGHLVKTIGFSGHHLGIAADIAAMTLGAEYIERHFTLDRTWKGTDHAASLEPGGMRKLVRDLDHVSQALTYKTQDILPVEKPQRKKLKTA